MSKIKMIELLPFIEDAIGSGHTFTIPITGTSMLPLLVQGRDTAELKKAELPLKVGDLPLYRRRDGAFVLHRVVGIEYENGEERYTMCGDNQTILEKGICNDQIIALCCGMTVDGKYIAADDKKYQKYVAKMCRNPLGKYKIRSLKVKILQTLAKYQKNP